MTGTLQRHATLLGLVVILGNCLSCSFVAGEHRFYSRAKAKEHFHRHANEFQSLVTDWVTHHPDDTLVFRPWYKGEVRWNDISILREGAGFIVQKSLHKGERADSFSSAARLAGADPADLENWVSSLRTLDVSSISVVGTELPSPERYVQIGLQESGANYGYLYVPSDHKEALNLITAASQKQPGFINMRKVESLAPKWFYFEGK